MKQISFPGTLRDTAGILLGAMRNFTTLTNSILENWQKVNPVGRERRFLGFHIKRNVIFQ